MPEGVSKADIALMVYDATLALLVHFLQPNPPYFVTNQIASAREAHLYATGEESLCPPFEKVIPDAARIVL